MHVTLLPLGALHPDTGLINRHGEIFLGLVDAAESPAVVTETAAADGICSVRIVSWSRFEKMIHGGLITDAYTLAAFGLLLASGLAPPVTRGWA